MLKELERLILVMKPGSAAFQEVHPVPARISNPGREPALDFSSVYIFSKRPINL